MRGHLTRKKLNEALKLYEEVCIELNDDGPHPFQVTPYLVVSFPLSRPFIKTADSAYALVLL